MSKAKVCLISISILIIAGLLFVFARQQSISTLLNLDESNVKISHATIEEQINDRCLTSEISDASKLSQLSQIVSSAQVNFTGWYNAIPLDHVVYTIYPTFPGANKACFFSIDEKGTFYINNRKYKLRKNDATEFIQIITTLID